MLPMLRCLDKEGGKAAAAEEKFDGKKLFEKTELAKRERERERERERQRAKVRPLLAHVARVLASRRDDPLLQGCAYGSKTRLQRFALLGK